MNKFLSGFVCDSCVLSLSHHCRPCYLYETLLHVLLFRDVARNFGQHGGPGVPPVGERRIFLNIKLSIHHLKGILAVISLMFPAVFVAVFFSRYPSKGSQYTEVVVY